MHIEDGCNGKKMRTLQQKILSAHAHKQEEALENSNSRRAQSSSLEQCRATEAKRCGTGGCMHQTIV